MALRRGAERGPLVIPLHAMFAAQLFLDIHHILGDKKGNKNQGGTDTLFSVGKPKAIEEESLIRWITVRLEVGIKRNNKHPDRRQQNRQR